MKKPVIKLINVSKKYHVDGNVFWALKNVNLTIFEGDRIGIIGNNGAGKTTLLKIIAGITKPSSGDVKIYKKVASIINVNAGFDSELTGKENILLNALIAGAKKKDVMQTLDSIIDFAGIGPYIDMPFYTYSSGMRFRLAFAVATAHPAPIIILDEAFQTADYQYQEKIYSIIEKYQKKSPLKLTTIQTSHIPTTIWRTTNRYFQLEKGVISEKTNDAIKTQIKKNDDILRKMFNIDSILSPNI